MSNDFILQEPVLKQDSGSCRLPILRVLFDTLMAPEDLPAFRGAVAERVGHEHEGFHNHNNSGAGSPFHYRYPLVQYKLRGNQPMLLCIGQEVQLGQLFLQENNWSFTLRRQYRQVAIDEFHFKNYPLAVEALDQGLPYSYKLMRWQALNQDNYPKYQEQEGLRAMIDFLEPLLANHLIAFAKGIAWQIPQRFEVQITEMYPIRYPKYKDIRPMVFNFNFDSNLLLPDHIGIGKGAALGFGTLTRIKRRPRR